MKFFPVLTFSFIVAATQMASAQLASKDPEQPAPPRVARHTQSSSQAAVAQAPRASQFANAPRNFSSPIVRQSAPFAGQQFHRNPPVTATPVLNQPTREFRNFDRNFAAVSGRRPGEFIPYHGPNRMVDPSVTPTNSGDADVNATNGRRADFQSWNRQMPNRNWRNRSAWQNQNSVWQNRSREGSNWQGENRTGVSFRDAFSRYHHEHHNRDWWRSHYSRIIIVNGGCYYWDTGYWYPAWGYDPYYSNYAYDGPIYGYDGLSPDQVIASVQTALQEEGYYTGAIDGVLGPWTRQAIAAWQRDHGLAITTVIDESTLHSLGLA